MDKNFILNVIKKHVIELLPQVDQNVVQPEIRLVDLGANSIDRAEIIVSVMEELCVKINPVQLHDVKNLSDLAELLSSELHAHGQ